MIGTGSGSPAEWSELEAQRGLRFPADYKDFVNHYGYLTVGGYIRVPSPLSSDPHRGLPAIISELDHYRKIQVEFGDYFPIKAYPEPGGLLPWATTINGDRLFWLTRGTPDEWTIVIVESRGPMSEAWPISMSEFILSFIKGNLRSEVFGDSASTANPRLEDPREDEPSPSQLS